MFQVSGIEKKDGKADHVWFAYAKSEASAKHLETLFHNAGYSRVEKKNLEGS